MARLPAPSEHAEQVALIVWADSSTVAGIRPGQYLFAIPNGGHRGPKGHIIGGKMKAEGVRPGVPDLMLAYPAHGYCGLFIEMKRTHGGGMSEHQKTWAARLAAVGYKHAVCRGYELAILTIKHYLDGKNGDYG